MQLQDYVNTFGAYLKNKYGQRVRKLSIDGNFSCPNRDGTIGRGGCTFCSVESFSEQNTPEAIAEQIQQRKAEIKHKHIKYLAYFQAYTNTHAEIETLKALYQQALTQQDVIGICVGTRPDCISNEVLELLANFQEAGKEVWLELGLQTANDKTLKKINRGHNFSCYQQAAEQCRAFKLNLCCHLILGLPGENHNDYRNTLNRVLESGTQGIKLHPLHIVKNSPMARSWKAGRIHTISQSEYVHSVVDLIQHTPGDIIYHRVTAQARPGTLLAPDWCGNKWQPLVAISRELDRSGGQGCCLG